MKTDLDKLYRLFDEAYGEGESARLFADTYGVKLSHPDTNEETMGILNPTNWGYFNRLLATGWVLDLIYTKQANGERKAWNFEQLELEVWLDVAINVETEQLLEIIQPLRPIGINPHLTKENLWMITFDKPLTGMGIILLENTVGLRVVGSQVKNGYAREQDECTYEVVVLTMEALQLPD